jgi:hypothetical protein
LNVMFGSRVAILVLTVLMLTPQPAHAGVRKWNEVRDGGLEIARHHRRSLEAALPQRERDLREASASLDRTSTLYARGLVTRKELDAAAREVADSRAQLERTLGDLRRTSMLIVEMEARQKLAGLPPLRPGQYEASGALIRYHGTRELSDGELALLERHVASRGGGTLPVSAMGQSDVHTRLGLDHRHAVDLALHPDSVEGRMVMGWLRARGISFLAFRGARSGAATGAHIHVGRASERWGARDAPPKPPALRGPGDPARSASAGQ